MQNLINRIKSWFTIPRNRRQFIIGAIGAFILVGVVAFSPQISNLLSLFGSKAGTNWINDPDLWQKRFGPEVMDVTQADGSRWLYSIGGGILTHDTNPVMTLSDQVSRMALDPLTGLPLGGEDQWHAVAPLEFGRYGFGVVQHDGYIYVVAGDIHTSPSDTDSYRPNPLTYSTIERLDVDNVSAGWELYNVITNVNFYPEVSIHEYNGNTSALHIVGGIYGNPFSKTPTSLEIGPESDWDIIPDSLKHPIRIVGAYAQESGNDYYYHGVPLSLPDASYGHNLANNNFPVSSDPNFGRELSDMVVGGEFSTSVSSHIVVSLSGFPGIVANGYASDEFGSDTVSSGFHFIQNSWRNNDVMAMGPLRFVLRNTYTLIDPGFGQDPYINTNFKYIMPVPQGRYGGELFTNTDNDLMYVGGISWSNPYSCSSPMSVGGGTEWSWGCGSDSEENKNMWVIEDENNAFTVTDSIWGPIGSTTGSYGNWGDNYGYQYVGNITYRWNDSSNIWEGTNATNGGNASRKLDDSYALWRHWENQGNHLQEKEGRALFGFADLGQGEFVTAGGLVNSDKLGYPQTSSRTERFAVDSWLGEAEIPYRSFFPSMVGSGYGEAVMFGGQGGIYTNPSLMVYTDDQGHFGSSTLTPYTYQFSRVGADINGQGSWQLVATEASDIPAQTGVVSINSTPLETLIYRAGGVDYSKSFSVEGPTSKQVKHIIVQATPNPTNPDHNQSNFVILPTENNQGENSRIGYDGYASAVAVFRLQNSLADPLPGIEVKIATDNDGIIEVCDLAPHLDDVSCGTPTTITTTTDVDGIAVLYIKSKQAMSSGAANELLTITGAWIKDGIENPFLGTDDNPDDPALELLLELAREDVPHDINSDVYFLNEQGQPDSSDFKQITIGEEATVKVQLLDNQFTPGTPDHYSYFIQMDATPDRDTDAIQQTIPFNGGAVTNGEAQFKIRGIEAGELELSISYKPKMLNLESWLASLDIPWVYLSKTLTLRFVGEAGNLDPNHAKQGDLNVPIVATGVATRWTQGATTVAFVNPPVITLNRAGGLDELDKGKSYDFNIDITNYPNQTVQLTKIEGGGSLTETSVETNGSGHASFTYETGTSDDIEKIQASIANDQIQKEMWLTVGQSTSLYTLEHQVSNDIVIENPYTAIRARMIRNSTGQPVIGSDPSFDFTNNDGGTLYDVDYNYETGIAKVIYKGNPNGEKGEIFIEATFNNAVSVTSRAPIINQLVNGAAGISIAGIDIVDDETITFNASVGETAAIGFWIFRVTTNVGGQSEVYDYAFEVQPKFVENSGIIIDVDPSFSHRGVSNQTVNITGIDTTFNAVADPTVTFISSLGLGSSDIRVVDIDPLSASTLQVTLDIASNAIVGNWDIEVTIGNDIKYTMPGNSDFVILPDHELGYSMDLVVGVYGEGWEPGSLPANSNATIDLITHITKLDVWDNILTMMNGSIVSSVLTSGTGTLTPSSNVINGGQALFTYRADTIEGNAIAKLSSTVADVLADGGEVDLEVSATLTKLAVQVTLNLNIPLDGSRYNYLNSEEIRVVIVKADGIGITIDDKFKIDTNDNIIGLDSFFVAPGATYYVWVDAPNHLAVGTSFVAPTVDATIAPILTSENGENLSYIGDINEGERNNQVNSLDWQVFFGQFLQDIVSPVADFSGDGSVNVIDWQYMFKSWFKAGYPKPF